MRVLGMDPGVSGAIAVLSDDGRLIEVFDMPVFKIKGKSKLDTHQLGRMIGKYATDSRAVIEQVGAMPGQGVTSMFTFGFCAGALHGAVGALGMPLELVSPRTWKARFRLSKDKEESRQAASRRWPGTDTFARVKDGGRAEAALIALYSIETSGAHAAADREF